VGLYDSEMVGRVAGGGTEEENGVIFNRREVGSETHDECVCSQGGSLSGNVNFRHIMTSVR